MTNTEGPRREFAAHVAARPDHLAVVSGDRSCTYAELNERCQRLARIFQAHGAGVGRPVAAVLPNGIEPFEVALAASMAGAPYLPINFHLKASELAYLLDDAGVVFVVGHRALSAELDQALAGLKGIEGTLVVGRDYEAAIEGVGPIDEELDAGPGPELVFYTSGTTSRPKGVVHAGLGRLEARRFGLEGQALLWGWSADDVYVMSGPAYHASHAGWGLTALYVGATVVVLDRFSAIGFLEAVARHGGTRSFMVPAHFIRILELPEELSAMHDISTLALVVHAAAPCPVAIKHKMIERWPTVAIHELYGASEGGATRISQDEWLTHPGSVGTPWPGVEVKVLDDDNNEVPTGETGLIWIKPPSTQRFTYRNDPDATAKAWNNDAFSVGDIGHVDAEGYLYITDRASDMVLWGGVNIAPREIEEVLYRHPAVVDCAVFGIPDERDGEHLKAIVQLKEPATEAELADFVRGELADYKVPHIIEITEELPRDPNGKVLKRLLRAAHGA